MPGHTFLEQSLVGHVNHISLFALTNFECRLGKAFHVLCFLWVGWHSAVTGMYIFGPRCIVHSQWWAWGCVLHQPYWESQLSATEPSLQRDFRPQPQEPPVSSAWLFLPRSWCRENLLPCLVGACFQAACKLPAISMAAGQVQGHCMLCCSALFALLSS